MLFMQSSRFKFVKIHSLSLKTTKVFSQIMKFNIEHQIKIAALYQANTFTISASSFSCCSYEEQEDEEEEVCAKTGKSLTKRRFSSPKK